MKKCRLRGRRFFYVPKELHESTMCEKTKFGRIGSVKGYSQGKNRDAAR
jgi:hypothetical protein